MSECETRHGKSQTIAIDHLSSALIDGTRGERLERARSSIHEHIRPLISCFLILGLLRENARIYLLQFALSET